MDEEAVEEDRLAPKQLFPDEPESESSQSFLRELGTGGRVTITVDDEDLVSHVEDVSTPHRLLLQSARFQHQLSRGGQPNKAPAKPTVFYESARSP